jgi:hypothetical protein
MTVKQYVSFLPPFVMRVIFASIGRVDVAADMFNLFPHEASQLLEDENKFSNQSIVELNIAEFVCLQQLALVLRRCCDPTSQKSPDTQLDGFQFLQAITKRQRGKLTYGQVRSARTNGRDKFRLDAKEASIARR